MQSVRGVFTKEGRAKYISHLDLMRLFTRTFTRAGLPLWYTEGFNPHLYMTFPLPLPLGTESAVERIDFRLVQPVPFETIVAGMNAILPEGIALTGMYEPVDRAETIAAAEYLLRFVPDRPGDIDGISEGWKKLCAAETLPVVKKTKKGETEMDIRPYFTPLRCGTGGTEPEKADRIKKSALPEAFPCTMDRENVEKTAALPGFWAEIRLAAGSKLNINPSLLLTAADGLLPEERMTYIRRTAILKGDLSEFV